MAAGALLRLGIGRSTRGGRALARAEDDYAAMLSAFPDVATNHSRSGGSSSRAGGCRKPGTRSSAPWRSAAGGRPPRGARLVFARQERFGDAIKEWRLAQKLDPKDPRPDRLIAEAEKRGK